MPITIKEIAKLAGVSVGTVDRVIHNRGRVKPEVAERVNDIVKTYGYAPSRAGRALVLTKKPVSIGIVVHISKTGFMQQVLDGIETVKAELESMGANVMVKTIPSMDAAKQLQAIDELLDDGAQAVAVSPVDDSAVGDKINELVSREIPVVTFNTDMAYTKRMCFVGLNNLQSGRVAAYLMGTMLGGEGKVAVITGHLTNQSHNLRVEGFLKEIKDSFENLQITGVHVCYEDDAISERQVLECMESIPDLTGLLVASGGESGVYSALAKTGAQRKIKVIAYDTIPNTITALKNGTVDFVIDQNAYAQGYQPAQILFEYLFGGRKPPNEFLNTEILIKTKLNF